MDGLAFPDGKDRPDVVYSVDENRKRTNAGVMTAWKSYLIPGLRADATDKAALLQL